MFLGGLKSEIWVPLRMFKATTMLEVTSLARMQEASIVVTRVRAQNVVYNNARYQSTNNANVRPQNFAPRPPILALPPVA